MMLSKQLPYVYTRLRACYAVRAAERAGAASSLAGGWATVGLQMFRSLVSESVAGPAELLAALAVARTRHRGMPCRGCRQGGHTVRTCGRAGGRAAAQRAAWSRERLEALPDGALRALVANCGGAQREELIRALVAAAECARGGGAEVEAEGAPAPPATPPRGVAAATRQLPPPATPAAADRQLRGHAAQGGGSSVDGATAERGGRGEGARRSISLAPRGAATQTEAGSCRLRAEVAVSWVMATVVERAIAAAEMNAERAAAEEAERKRKRALAAAAAQRAVGKAERLAAVRQERAAAEGAGAERRSADASSPPATGRLRLASWNLKKFTLRGPTVDGAARGRPRRAVASAAATDSDDTSDADAQAALTEPPVRVRNIAATIVGSHLDCAVLQEVMSSQGGQHVMEALVAELNRLTAAERYAFALSPPTGNYERYGVLWRIDRLGDAAPELALVESLEPTGARWAQLLGVSQLEAADEMRDCRAVWREHGEREWPQLVVSGRTDPGPRAFCVVSFAVNLLTFHLATSKKGGIKQEVVALQALAKMAAASSPKPLILLGDANVDEAGARGLWLRRSDFAPQERLRSGFTQLYSPMLSMFSAVTSLFPVTGKPMHNDNIWLPAQRVACAAAAVVPISSALLEDIRGAAMELSLEQSVARATSNMAFSQWSDHCPVFADIGLEPS